MLAFALYFLGGQKQILTSFPFQLLVLAGNFFLTKWTLKASGIDDEVENTSSTESVSARVTLTLATGEHHAALVLAPMGSVSRPYALEDHLAGAERQLVQRYPAPKVTAFLDLAQRLSALGKVRELATFLD